MKKNTLVVNNQNNEPITVGVSDLKPSPLNSFDATDIEELAGNIRALGLLVPLSVAGPDEDGKYEILSGERRFRAISLLNEEGEEPFMEKVPCYVIGPSDMSETSKRLAIEIGNLEVRDDFNVDAHRFEVIRLYKQLADEGTVAEKHIVGEFRKTLKLSKRYSVMYMTVFRDGIPELMDSVQSDLKKPDREGGPVHIPVSIASRIATLPEDDQKEALQRINSGEDAAGVVSSLKKKEPREGSPDPFPGTGKGPEAVRSVAGGVRPGFIDADDDLYGGEEEEPEDLSWLENAAKNGEDIGEDFDFMGFMRSRYDGDNMDLDLDTTGELKRLKSGSGASLYDEERKQVSHWLKRVRSRMEKREMLEPEDAELMSRFLELADTARAYMPAE